MNLKMSCSLNESLKFNGAGVKSNKKLITIVMRLDLLNRLKLHYISTEYTFCIGMKDMY